LENFKEGFEGDFFHQEFLGWTYWGSLKGGLTFKGSDGFQTRHSGIGLFTFGWDHIGVGLGKGNKLSLTFEGIFSNWGVHFLKSHRIKRGF